MGSLPQPRNLHERGGVRRVTSASSTPICRARRSTCSIDSLNRARSGSGKFACVCCIAKASAIIRSSFRCRGFNRSQSRRFALRFRPSHSSPVPAGRPVSGSAEVVAAAFGFFIRNSTLGSSSPSYLEFCRNHGSPNVSQSPVCRLSEKCSAGRSPAAFPLITGHGSRDAYHQSPVTSHFFNASIFSPLICPPTSTRPVTRIARVSNTNPP
jgi:hypothetical protein